MSYSYMTKLKQVGEKVDEERAEMMNRLYAKKKDEITLDGQPALIIRIDRKFPAVAFVGGKGGVIEFSTWAVERILNGSCEFRS